MIPVLETPRLLIRPIEERDFEAFAAIHADPDVVQYLAINEAWSRETSDEFLRDLLGHYITEGMGHMAVVRREDGALLGRCGLSSWYVEGEVELGYTLARQAWGKGYASEASGAMREYGFGVLGLPRLISLIDPLNVGSARVAIKNGFVLEGETDFRGRAFQVWGGGAP